jgi:hypothetical protein
VHPVISEARRSLISGVLPTVSMNPSRISMPRLPAGAASRLTWAQDYRASRGPARNGTLPRSAVTACHPRNSLKQGETYAPTRDLFGNQRISQETKYPMTGSREIRDSLFRIT